VSPPLIPPQAEGDLVVCTLSLHSLRAGKFSLSACGEGRGGVTSSRFPLANRWGYSLSAIGQKEHSSLTLKLANVPREPTCLLDFPWKEVEMSGASPELETAHDLFVDIVGYSRHTLPDQLRLQDGLQQALRDSAEFLQDLDYFEIKHGERLRVFSLVRDGLGTRAKPEKMIQTRVVLLNKRNAQPDDEILKLLVTQLRANGCYVFLDRHLKVGVEWAKEIERQIRSADVVIPLLSAGSMYSEMLAYEVEEAHKAFQAQGTPRLLPVRVAYTGPLSEEIAGVLDPVRQFLWETMRVLSPNCSTPSRIRTLLLRRFLSKSSNRSAARSRSILSSGSCVRPRRSFAPPSLVTTASCSSKARARWARPPCWHADCSRGEVHPDRLSETQYRRP
jgi:hypothetical protein